MAARPRQLTIIDVAAAAGVSKSTVSRVLNDPSSAPQSTREKVLNACAQLGYYPNSAARALRAGRSELVALMVGDISQPYHSALAKGVERAAHDRGYSVVLLDLDLNDDRLADYLDVLATRDFRGAIIATSQDIQTPALRPRLDRALDAGVAIVSTSLPVPYSRIQSVSVDRADTAYRATRHLLEQGCRSVALLAGDPSTHLGRPLVQGYQDALAADPHDPSAGGLVLAGGYGTARSATEVSHLLAQNDVRPDGYVVANVYSALGVYAAYEQLDLPTPLVVCCENVPLLDHIRPRTDAFGIDYAKYGDLLLAAMEPPSGITLTTGLVTSTLVRRRTDLAATTPASTPNRPR